MRQRNGDHRESLLDLSRNVYFGRYHPYLFIMSRMAKDVGLLSKGAKYNSMSTAGRSVRLALLTFVTAALMAAPSQAAAESALWLSVPMLLVIILVGILFDMLGVAAAVADEVPFNAMAAKKVPGARHSLRILRNVSTVSSFTSDFIGDIVGTLTGALGAAIVFRIGPFVPPGIAQTLAVALIAAITVGGKAAGKHIAVAFSTEIVLKAGFILYWMEENLGLVILPDTNPRRRGTRKGR